MFDCSVQGERCQKRRDSTYNDSYIEFLVCTFLFSRARQSESRDAWVMFLGSPSRQNHIRSYRDASGAGLRDLTAPDHFQQGI